MIATINATTFPKASRDISCEESETEPPFIKSYKSLTVAINIIGTANTKENSAASFLVIP